MSVRDLDCLCEACPIPVIKAIKEFKTMKAGDILVLHVDHSCVEIDLGQWAKKNGYPIETIETDDGEWEIYIEKPKEE